MDNNQEVRVKERPTVTLIGEDGNVFNIIGRCKRAARAAGWTREEVSDLVERMMNAGTYQNVLAIAMDEFDIE